MDEGEDSESVGSDSNPSEDELPEEELIKIIPKKLLSKKQRKLLQDEKDKKNKIK